MIKRVTVNLSEDELKLVKWLAKRDEVTVGEELSIIFNTEMYQLTELYMEQMKMEES